MKAIVVGEDHARLDRARGRPELHPDLILVRPVAVALNPTDWKHIKYRRARRGCIMGCDYAGIVESVGSAVTKSLKPGDRVFGCGHGSNMVNPDDGVFAEVAAVIGDLQMRIPDHLSFEEAATLGLGSFTVGQGLYQKALQLDLPQVGSIPSSNGVPVLIYGGSTATGALGIQYAKQSGYTVITACSSENFDFVKGLGADYVVDYHDKSAAAQIRALTNNSLRLAWDTISIEDSARICAESLTTSSGFNAVYGALLPVESHRANVKAVYTAMHTVFGKAFAFGVHSMPAIPDDFEFGKSFARLTERLLEERRLKPHPYRIGDGGLEGVLHGLKELEEGKLLSGKGCADCLAMASFMAPAPRAFFCFFEPAIVTLGGLQIVLDPASYSAGLLSYVPAHEVAATEQLAIASLGNFMLLVGAMIAVVMWRSRDPGVVRPVVVALILTDVGIWVSAVRIMGWERFVDAGSWSGKLTQLFSGMLATVLIKCAYLVGWLGADRMPGDAKTNRS